MVSVGLWSWVEVVCRLGWESDSSSVGYTINRSLSIFHEWF